MDSRVPAYFESWALEFQSRADRVRLLIGAAHWLSDGMHKESLLREFLRRHLPIDLSISRGFVRRLDTDVVSPEVDIIVSDPHRHVPLFNEGDLQIVAPSSVLATLEVKSTYRKDVLAKALLNVAKVRGVICNPAKPADLWSAILFGTAEKPQPLEDILQDLTSILGNRDFRQEIDNSAISAPQKMPCVIAVLDSFLVLLSEDQERRSVLSVRAFSSERWSAALAMAQLFGFLRANLTRLPFPGELDALLERIDGLSVVQRSIVLE